MACRALVGMDLRRAPVGAAGLPVQGDVVSSMISMIRAIGNGGTPAAQAAASCAGELAFLNRRRRRKSHAACRHSWRRSCAAQC